MKKNVLIIEDEENIAKAQELILQEQFNVHHARDGQDGLDKAKKIRPDLIILDLMMPKMDGVEVCRNIRSDESMNSTKIVMVTAKDKQKDEIEGMNIGADDYIMKPFEADELLHVVNQVLD